MTSIKNKPMSLKKKLAIAGGLSLGLALALDGGNGHVPLVNRVICRGIDPYGYAVAPKVKSFIPNLIFGREIKAPEREDAWRLYLGLPQLSNTFTVSRYNPEGLEETCYSMKDFFDLHLSFGDPAEQIRSIRDNPITGTNTVSGDFRAMGGYKLGASKDDKGSFLYYHDLWDLNAWPENEKGFFGKPFHIYDRLYFNEKTCRPERPLKKMKRKDLERI